MFVYDENQGSNFRNEEGGRILWFGWLVVGWLIGGLKFVFVFEEGKFLFLL